MRVTQSFMLLKMWPLQFRRDSAMKGCEMLMAAPVPSVTHFTSKQKSPLHRGWKAECVYLYVSITNPITISISEIHCSSTFPLSGLENAETIAINLHNNIQQTEFQELTKTVMKISLNAKKNYIIIQSLEIHVTSESLGIYINLVKSPNYFTVFCFSLFPF